MASKRFLNYFKQNRSKNTADPIEEWHSLDIGECKWTTSGKFFAGGWKDKEGITLKVWSLQRTAFSDWFFLPIKSILMDGPHPTRNNSSSENCSKDQRSLFIETSGWDDGDKNVAIAFLSIHNCSKHTSHVDYLRICKSQVDKYDSTDEIINLFTLFPANNPNNFLHMSGDHRQISFSPDGCSLLCSLPRVESFSELFIFKNPLDSSKVRLICHVVDSLTQIAIWSPDSRLIALWGNGRITFLEVNTDASAPNQILGSVMLNETVWGYPHPLRFLRKSNPNSNNFLYVLGNTINCFQIHFSSGIAETAAAASPSYSPPSIVPFFRVQVSSALEFAWLTEDPHLPVFYALKRSVRPAELHCFALDHLRLVEQSDDSSVHFELDASHTSSLWTHPLPSGRLSSRHQLEANPRFPVLGVVEWDGPTFKVTLVDTGEASVRLRFVTSLQTLALRALLSQPARYESERHSGRLPKTLHELLSHPINFPSATALIHCRSV